MSILLSLVLLVTVVLVIFWIVDAIPTPYPLSMIIKVVVGILAIVKLLQLAGLSF